MNEIGFDIGDVNQSVRCEHFRLCACLCIRIGFYFIFKIFSILSIDNNLIEIA